MSAQILFIDDEPNILQAFERQLRKHFSVETALGPQPGLMAVEKLGPYAVIVSDLRMPGMDGVQLLARARTISPDSVRVMLTGHADISAAIAAVNEGNIFRFLTKPCPSEVLIKTLSASLEQYRLVTAERELLSQTLNGSIRVLTEVLGLVNPIAFSRAHRVRRYVRHMAHKLNLPDAWEFELAAMLCQIGLIAVPPEILDKVCAGENLSEAEQEILDRHPQLAFDLLAHIPRLETVAQMIAGEQDTHGPLPYGDRTAMGALLLRAALDFDAGGGRLHSSRYDPALRGALESIHLLEGDKEERLVNVADLSPGMILHQDVRTRSGVLLIARGHEVTHPMILRLKSFARAAGVAQPFSVLAPRAISLCSLPGSPASTGAGWTAPWTERIAPGVRPSHRPHGGSDMGAGGDSSVQSPNEPEFPDEKNTDRTAGTKGAAYLAGSSDSDATAVPRPDGDRAAYYG